MKILFILLCFSSAAMAVVDGSSSLDLYEKSFGRANSICTHNKNRVEVMIRGGSKFTEIKERGYGEYAFYKVEEKVRLFNFSKSMSTLYHFYKPHDGECSNTSGYPLAGEKFAILFGEEYRPHGTKLIIQLFDFKKMIPLETINTNLIVKKAYGRPGGFVFKSQSERYDMDMGYVQLDDQKYTYQDRAFPVWMRYDDKGMHVDAETTFQKLPWRKYFKDVAEFYKVSGYDAEKKIFVNKLVYYAVKHPITKRCVLFLNQKKKLDGKEDWRCIQAM